MTAPLKSHPHLPVRTCAGCGKRAPRCEMRRFGADGNGQLEWRSRGGRGSYLHLTSDCATLFSRRKKGPSGLRTRISPQAKIALLATSGIS